MHFATKFAVAAAALAASVSAQLTVASPAALIQCQPVQLSWSGSTAGGPFYVALLPGGQASATPIEDLGEIQSSPYSWTVNIPAGTSVTIRVTDSSGQPQYSDPITIQDSQSTSCLTDSASSASGSSSATGSAGASASGDSSASVTDSGSASPTGSGAASTSSPNAGSSVAVGSLTGLAGLVIAALGVVA